ncbi:DUF6476 family protein [Jannaschia donghaensis]|nr:DUF6476 family protein [Jannaschia donghaensis]
MDENPGLPPDLRFLKTLVTMLTGVMIVGLITVVVLLVTRLPGAAVTLPDRLQVPNGTSIVAVTQAPSYWIATTTDDRVLIFAPDGTFRRDIPLD